MAASAQRAPVAATRPSFTPIPVPILSRRRRIEIRQAVATIGPACIELSIRNEHRNALTLPESGVPKQTELPQQALRQLCF
jgi:hypothetical protein